VIKLDMDGVVADFFTAALRWHGGMPYLSGWPRGISCDGKTGDDIARVLGLTNEEFYAPLMLRDFWDDIKPYPGAPEFVESLREVGTVKIYTVITGDHDVCMEAKRNWCSDYLHIYGGDVIFCTSCQDKVQRVGQRGVLIDDHPITCEGVRRAGGRALLVPRPWNSRDPALRFDRVDYRRVLQMLEDLL